jgi:uncharacterized protein (TIGR03435 family)
MQAMDDLALLREYAARNSEAAFETLVSRRVGFVYAAALRQMCDPHLAEEITQAVFIILAQKAGRISDKTILAGWLFKTTRFAAIAQTRADAKRQQRELEVQMQTELQSAAPNPLWEKMSPLLDEALASLGETDRQAVLLRFFENKSLAEVGSHLGTGEDTARKRVTRALEKLHRYFNKRGVNSTTTIIAGAISANSVQAAPVTLAKSVTAVAMAKGAAASGPTLTLIKGALKIMAWTKAKTTIVVGVGILLAAGTTTVTVKEIQEHRTYPWQVSGFSSQRLNQAPPQVAILPSKVPIGGSWGTSDQKVMGTGILAKDVVAIAFDPKNVFSTSIRMILSAELPQGRYDFIASLASGNMEALQKEVKQKFGIVVKRETRETDALLLTVKYPNAKKLKPSVAQSGETGNTTEAGKYYCRNDRIGSLGYFLEYYFKTPVLDRTGLTSHFDIDLTWDEADRQHRNPDALKQALLDQLGLELVPSREPIEMLVVEKVP